MHFCDREALDRWIRGRRVALVGSGPGVLDHEPGFIDAHETVVRVNNYKLSPAAGARTDVFFSFFGSSIRKTAQELKRDGVKLCVCKCPNAKFMDSAWHRESRRMNGVDFRYLYRKRARWWFCPTLIPSTEEFLRGFDLLGGHVPTTGFAALLDILDCAPASLYLTGFDFFASGIHNVDKPWRAGDPSDPIGHRPERERAWLAAHLDGHPISLDPRLRQIMRAERPEQTKEEGAALVAQ